MKFFIKYTGYSEPRTLFYWEDEYSFDMDPLLTETDLDIVINTLNLTVLDGKVVQVWGFCGLRKDMNAEIFSPQSQKGELKIIDTLEYGFSHRLNKEEWPVFVNYKTGWVCMGEPHKIGEAVEFIDNCIAVINDDQEISSLWLKPQKLPCF